MEEGTKGQGRARTELGTKSSPMNEDGGVTRGFIVCFFAIFYIVLSGAMCFGGGWECHILNCVSWKCAMSTQIRK